MLDILWMVITIISLSLIGIYTTEFKTPKIPVTVEAMGFAFIQYVYTNVYWILLSAGVGIGFVIGSL